MLPQSLLAHLSTELNIQILDVQPCHGGDINQAVKIVTANEPLFVKWNPHAPRHMFSAEAKGLQWLKAANALRVPEVVMIHEAEANIPAFLVLEWLTSGAPTPQTMRQLGHGLAKLHALHREQHGLDHDNFAGSLPQTNMPHKSWARFYSEQRIRPQMEIARQRGHLTADREHKLQKLIATMEQFLPSDAPASLLHGDLWRGNLMVLSDGQPAIIDPAIYYGHAEVELAFIDLFGNFGAGFWDVYRTETNFDMKAYQTRRALLQLYPYLVHLNIFGGGYASAVDSILRHYLG